MTVGMCFLLYFVVALTAGYFRWTAFNTWFGFAVTTLLVSLIGTHASWALYTSLFAISSLLFFWPASRKRLLTGLVFRKAMKAKPEMSQTEREALSSGSVWWEGQLFSGKPNWSELLNYPKPRLTNEEQAFLDGPVEDLCRASNDWEITHYHREIPQAIWKIIKKEGFLGLIIPKRYGGKGFSAYAHARILYKIYSVSASVATTVSVPNSLGPAELLLQYGTEEQRNHYLPRLSSGEEIPCFALTNPNAGSDASAIPDTGVVCKRMIEGQEVLGITVNFDKRYITLAPVATVVGLAFKLKDPEHILGNTKDLGITVALVPRDTKGVEIGRRHFPCNIAFANGPVKGKDVFIPMDAVVGGQKQVGQGWKMLMECLAAGRAISLPSSAVGGTQAAVFMSGAYARVRRQFNVPIAQFEGIAELLARMTAKTYMIDAAVSMTATAIDSGEHPAVASAILKYHATENGRTVANDAMDLHGGKGICMGPSNYIGRGYQSVPIAITVEGANILTRNLIIFGQGAMRCHPYIFELMSTLENKEFESFDHTLFAHLGNTLSNVMRSTILSLTGAYGVRSKVKSALKREMQQATRYSAAFAFVADAFMLMLGSQLKRRELVSARLGDIFSELYLVSGVIKRFHDEQQKDALVAKAAAKLCFYRIEQAFKALLDNAPNRLLGLALRALTFPFGFRTQALSDKEQVKLAEAVSTASGLRERLTHAIYLSADAKHASGLLQAGLLAVLEAEPAEKIMRKAVRQAQIEEGDLVFQARQCLEQGLLVQAEVDKILYAEKLRQEIIAVDDFSDEELAHDAISLKHQREALLEKKSNAAVGAEVIAVETRVEKDAKRGLQLDDTPPTAEQKNALNNTFSAEFVKNLVDDVVC